MRKVLILCVLILASCAKNNEVKQVAELSCGQCKFGIEEPLGCDLAVKIDGKAYFIDGAHIDDFGDAHDINLGFCNVIRKANVVGKIEEGRFKATSIKLIE